MINKLIQELKFKGITNKKVLQAIKNVPREFFIISGDPYADTPLPLIKGQTISQPYTVAIMLEALELKQTDKVLEIGAGSGWNAALIAYIAKKGKVFTIEIIPELVQLAKKNLKKLNIKNVTVIHADGSKGYEKEKPYNKIIVTAAAPKTPNILLSQLKKNGILVIPVGHNIQHMLKIKKLNHKLEIKNLGTFLFVKLRGEYGWKY